MKKKSLILGFAVLLTAAMAMTGCGKSGGGQTALSVKDYVYKLEEVSAASEEENIDTMFMGGDRLYAYGYNYQEDGETSIELLSLNQDGTLKEKTQIPLTQGESLNSLKADGQGFLYGIRNVYSQEPDEEGNYQDKYYLVKMTEKGEEVFSVELNNMPELQEICPEDSYFYVGTIMIHDNFLYVNIAGYYVQFDMDGKFVKILKNAEGNPLEGANLFSLGSGKSGVLLYEETGTSIGYVDMNSYEITEKSKIPGASYEYSVYTGIGYDLYLVNSYGVFGYNVGDEDKTQLMSYIDSDLGVFNVYNVLPVSKTEFFATYMDMETSENTIGKFTKVDPKDVKDKKVLVLACAGMDWDVKMSVVKFNKASETYRITIQDYSSLYGDENDYMAGINRLNADIVSGKVPDILLINSNMPVQSYMSKGLFEDIKPYIEQDPELDMNNYMPNVIEAFSNDGKLYRVIPSYMINTIAAKTSEVGKERGWTIQEAMELIESKPEGTKFVTYASKETMLRYGLSVAGNQFINWETGECSFDSDGFIQFLEFLMIFPDEEEAAAVYDDSYWENYDSMWREGKVIAQTTNIVDFRNYNILEKGTFGEDITLIGFPSSNGDGSAIMANMQLAMSAKSKNKEGAWEFLRYFLTDEYQNEITYGLPLSIKRLDELGEKAMKNPTYTDENGNEVETEDFFYIDGVEIKIPPMTKEEVEELKKEIYSFTNVYNYDENLIQIVQEETAAYFGGQKSAEEVAGIIQSRVKIYVNENR